jgi:hypothetical protein
MFAEIRQIKFNYVGCLGLKVYHALVDEGQRSVLKEMIEKAKDQLVLNIKWRYWTPRVVLGPLSSFNHTT